MSTTTLRSQLLRGRLVDHIRNLVAEYLGAVTSITLALRDQSAARIGAVPL
jgi:hypothetical protein